MRFQTSFFAALLLTLVSSIVQAAPISVNRDAMDFPPGVFSDNGNYHLSDFEGKVLVLFFYEQDCPSCRGTIPAKNELVAEFKDKPIKFIAVAAGDSSTEATAYIRETKLAMPAYADPMGVMEHIHGFHISLRNIYQTRIIGPDGSVVGTGWSRESFAQALQGVDWRFRDESYPPQVAAVAELMEWNQWEPAANALRPLRSGKSKNADAARKLYDALTAEGEAWIKDATEAEESNPVRALQLWLRIKAIFPREEIAKPADEKIKKLKATKVVKDEQAAQQMFSQLANAMKAARPQQSKQIQAMAQTIASKYADTPTGKRAAVIAKSFDFAVPEQ